MLLAELEGTDGFLPKKRDEGKLADLQVKTLWRMFGKHIYGAKSAASEGGIN